MRPNLHRWEENVVRFVNEIDLKANLPWPVATCPIHPVKFNGNLFRFQRRQIRVSERAKDQTSDKPIYFIVNSDADN